MQIFIRMSGSNTSNIRWNKTVLKFFIWWSTYSTNLLNIVGVSRFFKVNGLCEYHPIPKPSALICALRANHKYHEESLSFKLIPSLSVDENFLFFSNFWQPLQWSMLISICGKNRSKVWAITECLEWLRIAQ